MALRVFVCVLQQPSRMSEHHLSSSSSSSSSASASAAAAVKTVATDYRPSSPPAHLRSSLSSFSSATATDHATHSAVSACLSRRASRDIVSARFRSVGHVLNRHVRHAHHSSAVDGFGNYDRKPAGQQFCLRICLALRDLVSVTDPPSVSIHQFHYAAREKRSLTIRYETIKYGNLAFAEAFTLACNDQLNLLHGSKATNPQFEIILIDS